MAVRLLRSKWMWGGSAAALLLGLALGTWLLFQPMDTEPYTRIRSSGEMCDRDGRLLYAFVNPDEQWCFRRPLNAFSPWLLKATIAVEDQRFYRHHGVDPMAIVRAIKQNLTGGRIVSGASTITMQLVKLAEIDSRSVPGKLRQAWTALRLERHLSKEAILESYLNTAPYGLNLIGAEAAARRYFGKPAGELTLSEAALLAGLPKAPGAFMPMKNKDRAQTRRDHVLRRMLAEGYISEEECRRAIAQDPGAAWHEFPQQAPHLAMHFRAEIEREGRLRVTLTADAQSLAERLLSRSLNRFQGDVTNGAAVVVDVASGTLLARVGSADFFGTPGGGQVDLCRAPRSPGSALKPFVYALAMQRDLLYPSEMLLDDTMDFGAYNPGNFDGEYRGLVSAREALRLSLNVPAIAVLQRVGGAPVQQFLTSLGLTTLNRPSDEYGLGLTLGNCEVRLEELAGAYTMLANLGGFRPLRIRADSAPAEARRDLSRSVALSVYEMLEQPLPGDPRDGLVRARGGPTSACWKTGTSTGYHDAWAFVFNRQYVVGVWLGNNTGKSSRRLIGLRSALPIAANLFRSLPPMNSAGSAEPGPGLRTVRICAATGLPASPRCPRVREDLVAQEQLVNRRCDVHRPAPDGSDKPVERWPGNALGWNLAQVRNPVGLEASKPAAQEMRHENLQILSPTNRGQYILTGEQGGDLIPLSASIEAEGELFWYMDGRYLGTSKPQTPLQMKLELGTHVVACMTAAGETSEVHFEVNAPRGFLEFKQRI